MSEEMNGALIPDDQSQNSENDKQGNQIPDWMKEAGWETDTGAFDESKPVFDDMEGEDDIVPAEIPSWLEEAAPEGFSLDSNLGDEESSAIIEENLIPITPPEKESPKEAVDEVVPEKQAPPKTDDEKTDVPSWLKNLELDEDSQETAIAWLENMPESLRATEEEKSKAQIVSDITGDLDDTVDELEWLEDQFSDAQKSSKEKVEDDAKLSEDLVASDLIPEQQEGSQLFPQEDLESSEGDVPSWLDELGSSEETKQQPDMPPDTLDESKPPQTSPVAENELEKESDSLVPDWLSEIGTEEDPLELEPTMTSTPVDTTQHVEDPDSPEWLNDFEGTTEASTADSDPNSLTWLESLAEKQDTPDDELAPAHEEEQAQEQTDESSPPHTPEPVPDELASDDTLSTKYPNWLANIGKQEKEAESAEVSSEEDFEESSNWLEQLADDPIDETAQTSDALEDKEVLEWLDGLDTAPDIPSSEDEIQEPMTGDLDEEATPPGSDQTETQAEGIPGWLGELATEAQDESSSLESAIRQSDHQLSDEEVQFLDQAEEEQEDNADWLAKLDLVEESADPEIETPAIKVDVPQGQETLPEAEQSAVTGGILDHLKGTGEITDEPEIPQWLENLKKEEDPQETAILWLKQFVEQGNTADINDEIKRYTSELDPGDTVPVWMEDLKHEEDPQTTAMLWLEKLSGEREVSKPKPARDEPDDSSWLAELEKEESEQIEEQDEEAVSKNFQETNEAWLADLDIDQKLKTDDEEVPDWTQPEEEEEHEGEPPPWMKATSPLDGDFYTDELAGSQEQEVEIPNWLAGYAEGEAPDESTGVEPRQEGEDATAPGDDYTWVPAGDEAQSISREPIELNVAAISQLESIIGISYQVAKGIVTFREKNGPYKQLKDLLQVPEISDEQTIEILKPEVIIREVKEKPKSPKSSAPVVEEPPEKRLSKARELLSVSQIEQALEHYEYLIIKKKSIDDVIEDLTKASLDHPLDIGLMKTLGDAYMRLDRLEEALDAYSKAEDLLR